MSVRLMALVWEIDIAPAAKLVLLAIADCANDEGTAWPSIATIARKSNCGLRTVQRSIREAETRGILKRQEVFGQGCKYTFHPRHSGTGATQAPVTNTTLTPATVAPPPRHSGTQTINEPSEPCIVIRARKKTDKKSDFDLPDWIPKEAWSGWVESRDKKPTDRAKQIAVNTLTKLKAKGHDPGAVLDQSTFNGWRGLFPLKAERNEPYPPNQHTPGRALGRTVSAAQSAIERLRS